MQYAIDIHCTILALSGVVYTLYSKLFFAHRSSAHAQARVTVVISHPYVEYHLLVYELKVMTTDHNFHEILSHLCGGGAYQQIIIF